MNPLRTCVILLLILPALGFADAIRQTKGDFYDAFRQLDVDLPTSNAYRTASGAPGSQYWQQRADYKIKVKLDESKRRIDASETITYINHSPDTLRYIWIQLDQNRHRDDSTARLTATSDEDQLSYRTLAAKHKFDDLEYGHEIISVADSEGNALEHKIVDTMMRIDLPTELEPGESNSFSIDWSFNMVQTDRIGGRNGYEEFDETDTYIYFLAQWFPRLAAYTDYGGWNNKQFLGRGEFALEFGDYEVEITVPEDHIVSASGELQNANAVLNKTQRERLREAKSAEKPVFIVTPEEALENEAEKATGTKTWKFRANNVRDFAWSSSRKFIWDAMTHEQDDADVPEVLAMSFYPNEAMPIWANYSTEAVVHTMEVYSRFAFNYPYPTAQSVNTWKRGGMEYPMITFNGYRPEPYESKKEDEAEDGVIDADENEDPTYTYSRNTKAALILVIIHEIGHIYFPMVVNSDERQWTWMDEGINTFLQKVAEYEWEDDFPQYGNKPLLDSISSYMTTSNQVPIMTQSDSVLQFGANSYAKPAAALTVLRETVMGRELFDFAFKEYAQRWKFRRPTPADFFRTMEDASGVDLDWFWRGWFYSTDHVDIAIKDVREYKISSLDPDKEIDFDRAEYETNHPEPVTQSRNREAGMTTRVERNDELRDFYNENDQFTVTNKDRNGYLDTLEGLEKWERDTLERALEDDDYIYFVDFENIGGLPMPLPLLITNDDGTNESLLIPAEIWRRNHKNVTKMLIREKAMKRIELDPHHETADADYANNSYPPRIRRSRIELYKSEDKKKDLMADMLEKLKETKTEEDGEGTNDVPLQQASE
ncbi:M1 family metallopeptidase [Puniceicoccaceae bacterium K14]|nr:M1 family metallopeptidase [Puniceicoccaceae bacterium K14]